MTQLSPATTSAELRRFADWLTFAAPRSATIVGNLADALHNDPAVADILLTDPAMSSPISGVRVLAGVHQLVLTGQLPELRELLYLPDPDCAQPCRDRVWERARQAILDHPDDVRAALHWPVQQHTPDRAGILLRGLAMLGERRVRLLEFGACAGFTLLVDGYRWTGPGWAWGPPASPLRLTTDGPAPPADLTIVDRAGCDIAPIDPTNPAHAMRLHAFIPPELTDVHQQIDSALALAKARPGLVEKASAGEWLRKQLAQTPGPGVHTVVWHCHVWHLLDRAEQNEIQELLTEASERFPLSYITAEPPDIARTPRLRLELFS